ERYAPVRHRALGIDLRGLLKRTDGRAVIESVKESETLVEVALGFGRISRDLARIRAESLIERFLRCIEVRTDQGQYRPDNELEDFGRRFHNGHAKLFVALSAATAN